jgi:hypothetical protein
MSNLNNKTGNTCKRAGTYYCETHPAVEITVGKDEEFPKCPQGLGHKTLWNKI